MATLRTLENPAGITRDSTNLQKLYAEDWNELKAKLDEGTDGLNTKSLKIQAVETISEGRQGKFSDISDDDNGKVLFVIKKVILYTQTTFQSIITLAQDAVVFSIKINCLQTLDSGQLLIGFSDDEDYFYAGSPALGFSEVSGTVPYKLTAEKTIGAKVDGSPTEGEFEIYVTYARF